MVRVAIAKRTGTLQHLFVTGGGVLVPLELELTMLVRSAWSSSLCQCRVPQDRPEQTAGFLQSPSGWRGDAHLHSALELSRFIANVHAMIPS